MDVYSRIGEICNDDFILTNARIFKDWGYFDVKPPILEKNYFIQMPVLHPSTFIRRTGIKFLSSLIKLVTKKKIYDVTSGYRACNKKLIKFQIKYNHKPYRLCR